MSRALLALSLVLLVPAAIAQTAPKANPSPNSTQAPVKKSPLVPYAGNWIGAFDNKPWLLLNLNLTGERFFGSLQRAREFDFSDNGELKHVSEDYVTYQLVEATLTPDGLLATFKDPDKPETQRYVMKLTGDSTAEIKMVAMTMPPGMPKPKPWKVMKVK